MFPLSQKMKHYDSQVLLVGSSQTPSLQRPSDLPMSRLALVPGWTRLHLFFTLVVNTAGGPSSLSHSPHRLTLEAHFFRSEDQFSPATRAPGIQRWAVVTGLMCDAGW